MSVTGSHSETDIAVHIREEWQEALVLTHDSSVIDQTADANGSRFIPDGTSATPPRRGGRHRGPRPRRLPLQHLLHLQRAALPVQAWCHGHRGIDMTNT